MDPLIELKHSIKTHLLVMNGPSPQLAVFLVKVIDFLEDKDTDRVATEVSRLAYAIIEAIALYIHQSIDTSLKRGNLPANKVACVADNLFVAIAKNRHTTNPMLSKLVLLKEIANCYHVLSGLTNAKYPNIADSDGNTL